MTEPTTFQVGEYTFRLAPLKLKKAMAGWSILANVILPAMISVAADELDAKSLASAIAGIERLPDLFDMFAEVAQVDWQGKGFVPLKAFQENVFERRSDLLLAFLAECVAIEFGPLVSANGRVILIGAANKFTSLLGSTGQSGG